MALRISENLSKTCVDKIYIDLSGFNTNNASTNKEKIQNINVFLTRVTSILNQEIKLTLNNWKMVAKYLLAFARMYHTLLTDSHCQSDYPQLIGQQKKWTEYLCTGVYRPMRMLYKLLSYFGILYTECNYFYIYNSKNKGKQVKYLSINNTLNNIYNSHLRFSKSNTKECLKRLSKVKIENISTSLQYIVVSLEIRKLFLTGKYCGGYIKNGEPDMEHEFFETNLQEFSNELNTLLSRWNDENLQQMRKTFQT
jgi:hypothetical protein